MENSSERQHSSYEIIRDSVVADVEKRFPWMEGPEKELEVEIKTFERIPCF